MWRRWWQWGREWKRRRSRLVHRRRHHLRRRPSALPFLLLCLAPLRSPCNWSSIHGSKKQEKCLERPQSVAGESMLIDQSPSPTSPSSRQLAIGPFAARSQGPRAPPRLLYPEDIEKDSVKRCCSAPCATPKPPPPPPQPRPCSSEKKETPEAKKIKQKRPKENSVQSLTSFNNLYSAQSGLLPARGALRGHRSGAFVAKPEGEPGSESERPPPAPPRLHSPAAVAGARSAALPLAATSGPQPSRRARASKCGGGLARTVTPPSGARRVREAQ